MVFWPSTIADTQHWRFTMSPTMKWSAVVSAAGGAVVTGRADGAGLADAAGDADDALSGGVWGSSGAGRPMVEKYSTTTATGMLTAISRRNVVAARRSLSIT